MRDWFPIDCDLFRKPKFVAFCRIVGCGKFEAAGRLVAVWAWIQSYGPQSPLDASGLDEATGTPPGTIDALIASGWATIEKRSRTVRFQWPGLTLAEQRQRCSEAGRRGNEIRWKSSGGDRVAIGWRSQSKSESKTEIHENTPDGVFSPPCDVETPSTGGVRKPRRHRISWSESGFDGITETDRKVWSEMAPAVDVDAELAKASAWLYAQPVAKRKRDLLRFLTNWFGRSQEAAAKRPELTNRKPGGTLPLGCYVDSSGVARTASGARLWRPGDDR
jgi:hypothetical protein